MSSRAVNMLALDPGPESVGWARCNIVGPRVRYVTGGLVSATPEHVEVLMREVDVVAIEVPKGAVFQPYRGPSLIATSRIAGAIAWMVKARRLKLIEFSAAEVRKVLCGKANADDHRVADAVHSNVIDFPARSNVHMRDASALAVVAAWQLAGGIGARAS